MKKFTRQTDRLFPGKPVRAKHRGPSCHASSSGWQAISRKPLPRVRLWYAGYAIWITDCKIPSKKTSWSQQCETKLIHQEMTCRQARRDQHNCFSIHVAFREDSCHICCSVLISRWWLHLWMRTMSVYVENEVKDVTWCQEDSGPANIHSSISWITYQSVQHKCT